MSTTDPSWQTLDRRSLLTRPLALLPSLALPVLIGGIGAITSGGWFAVPFVLGIPTAVIFAVSAVTWLTTSYRITPSHLEVKTGLFNTKTVTARLDRVRSVDLEAPLVHRALEVTRVKIGTGVDDGQITLDALSLTTAEAVRRHLLHRDAFLSGPTAPSEPGTPGTPGTPSAPQPEASPGPTPLAQLSWSWLRFAPLNLVNLTVVGAAAVAVISQAADLLGPARDLLHTAEDNQLALSLVIPVVALTALGIWIVGSCLGYALRWYDFTLTRDQGKDGPVLHQSGGLVTTRSTTVDETKVRGARIRQQLLIAAAGGAELSALTIGMKNNTPALLPTAPLADVRRVATDLLTDPAPVTTPLISHGRRPLGRYLRRALLATVPVVVFALGGTLVDAPIWAGVALVVLAWAALSVLAWVRWRNLGHALTATHLVAQSGALVKDRTVLEIDGIVGWSIHQSFFDRRLGLAQLTATTAAGEEKVVIQDVPLAEAVRTAASATPHLLAPFTSAR